jgi:hypothetical protein
MKWCIDLPHDSFVAWKKRTSEPLMDLFSNSDWRLIFSDVENEEQLEEFLQLDCGRCLVAYNTATDAPFGFIYVYMEDEREKKVSLHGGGWLPNNVFLNYRAYILLIENLLQYGYKVRTACRPENVKAIRFNRSIGFVNHYTTKNYRYFWISEKRLHGSSIYQHLMKRERK